MPRGKIHALLATSRVANIPSVVSNVWVGVAVGVALNLSGSGEDEYVLPWDLIARLVACGICLYIAGNFANDWADFQWDKQHRPERGLPSGLFAPGTYLFLAIGFSMSGVSLAATVNPANAVVAVLILACIAVYTAWHKRAVWPVIPMGLCRALLPMLGAVGMIRPSDTDMIFTTCLMAIFPSAALFCYIVALSLSARRESMVSPSPSAGRLPTALFILAGAVVTVPFAIVGGVKWVLFVAPIPYIAWFGMCRIFFRKPIPRYVSSLLAGIPLVDWIFLIPFSLWELFMHTPRLPSHPDDLLSLAIPPLAFISALLLQRLAPAT